MKRKTLLLNLEDTLVHITPVVKFGDKIINIKFKSRHYQVIQLFLN